MKTTRTVIHIILAVLSLFPMHWAAIGVAVGTAIMAVLELSEESREILINSGTNPLPAFRTSKTVV